MDSLVHEEFNLGSSMFAVVNSQTPVAYVNSNKYNRFV